MVNSLKNKLYSRGVEQKKITKTQSKLENRFCQLQESVKMQLLILQEWSNNTFSEIEKELQLIRNQINKELYTQ